MFEKVPQRQLVGFMLDRVLGRERGAGKGCKGHQGEVGREDGGREGDDALWSPWPQVSPDEGWVCI